MSGWWETVERQAMTDSDKDGIVNPQRLVWELSSRLPGQRHRGRRLRIGGQLVRPAPQVGR